MRNEFKLHQLHVDKTSYTPIAVVKEEDNVTLNLELFKDNIPLSLTGQTITLSALRSDKVIVEQTTGFTISNTNRLNIKLKNNVICKSGIVYLELTLTDSTGSMTTLDFYLKVNRKILGHESIQGSDNIASLEKIKQEFNRIIEEATINEEYRQTKEQERQTYIESEVKPIVRNEEYRQAKEQERQDYIENTVKPKVAEIDEFDIKLTKKIEKVYETINDGSFIPFDGTDITVDNSKEGYTKDTILKGQTYQNLIDYNDATMKGGSTTTVVKSQNSIKATVTKNGSSIVYFPCKMLKDNTVYTLLFNLITNYNSGTLSASFKQGGNFAESLINIKNGYCKIKITTTTANEGICIGNLGIEEVGNNIEIQNLIVLEGDWTNKEVPSSITGIESVVEKEGNKISILSLCKNLFPTLQIGDSSTDYIDRRNLDKCARIRLKPNTKYVLSYNCKSSNVTNSTVWATQIIGVNTNQKIINDYMIVQSKNENIAVPFTTTTETEYHFGFIPNNGDSTGSYLINKNSIMLEEGTTSTQYEPYKEDKKEILLPLDGA